MLILASTSAARRALLNQITAEFSVISAPHDETVRSVDPIEHARACAFGKISAVLNTWPHYRSGHIISADTILYFGRQIFGKPANATQAASFLRTLSSNCFQIHTITAVCAPEQHPSDWRWRADSASVQLHPISEVDIDQWCRTSLVTRCAGALALQGVCARWVKRLRGDYSTVLGMSLTSARALLRTAGAPVQHTPGSVASLGDWTNA
ncbi:MAG: Maf family protein [Gammaproteobacteria bacterium]|nr:Maf family protein [Gammaproteobacteria bacterium]